MVALIVTLIIDITALSIKYTLEAGEELPSAAKLSGRSGAVYDFGDNGEEFNIPGEYKIYIIDGSRRITVKLTVVDTEAPVAEVLALKVNQNGPFPEAIDFFKNITDASEVEAKFKNEVNPTELDKPYAVSIELSDIYGNKRTYDTTITKTIDKEAPKITLPRKIAGYLGEAIAYRKDIVVTDNCFGEVDIIVDDSAVDTSKAGSYKVKYTVTDKAGNFSTAETVLVINAHKYTYEQLMNDKIKPLAASLGLLKSSLSKEEQCKIIYNYVNSPTKKAEESNVVFVDSVSHTNHSDWITEAYLTLEAGSGDCFSYFAVSKALFEYLGIENLDIQRSPNVKTQSGTHFWNMVNIGDAKNPRWYYYDATRLKKPHKSGNACLFTEEQLEDYNTNVNIGFLTFDHEGYPITDTTVINKNYTW